MRLLLAIACLGSACMRDWVVLEDRCQDGACELPCNATRDCDPELQECPFPPEWPSCAQDEVCVAGSCVEAAAGCTLVVDAATGSPDGPGTSAEPFTSVQAALDSLDAGTAPGAAVCVRDGLYEEQVSVVLSGTAEAPLSILATGAATLRTVTLWGDFIELSGFEVTHQGLGGDLGTGILLAGTDQVVFDTYVHHTHGIPILCDFDRYCDRAAIVRNQVTATSTGVWIQGDGVRLAHNTIVEDTLCDRGVAYFGSNVVVEYNRVDGCRACLQSWDNDTVPPLTNALLRGNLCLGSTRVCIEAGGDVRHQASGLRIDSNVCDTDSTSNIDFWSIPSGVVTNNLVIGRTADSAVSVSGEPAVVSNNLFLGSYSQHYRLPAGSSADHNLAFASDPAQLPAPWSEPHGLWNVDPLLDSSNANPWLRYQPQAVAPVVDAGDNRVAGSRDLLGRGRVRDGNDDGNAVVDTGPVEHSFP